MKNMKKDQIELQIANSDVTSSQVGFGSERSGGGDSINGTKLQIQNFNIR